MRTTLVISLIFLAPLIACAENIASQTNESRDARMQWWREARFGMFIHFGLYAIPGRGEWVQWNEQELAPRVNPQGVRCRPAI